MKIGVVSDTHNNLKNVREIIALFNDAAVERVIHTGDITQAKVMEAFALLNAPLFGVYGMLGIGLMLMCLQQRSGRTGDP